RRVQEEVREAPRARDAEPEQLVGLLVEEIVRGGAQSVAPETVRALGVVLGDVEECRGRRRPRDGRHTLDAIGLERPRAEVLHVQRVLAEPRDVDRVNEAPAVVARGPGAEREERVPLGQAVEVERDLLGRVEARVLATQDRVGSPAYWYGSMASVW